MKIKCILLLFISLFFCSCNFEFQGKRYAFIYGISIYNPAYPEGQSINLNYCDNDALAVKTLLEKQGFLVTMRLNSEATKEIMLNDLKTANVTQNDTVLFYYSGHGHGTLEDPNGYIVAYPVSLSDLSPINTKKLLSDVELLDAMENVPCLSRIIILDSCFSGAFVNTQGGIDTVSPNYEKPFNETIPRYAFNDPRILTPASLRFIYAEKGSQVMVLSAAGAKEFSQETSTLQQGVFTYFFLKSLDYSDINNDSLISITECFSFVKANIDYSWNKPIGEKMLDGNPPKYLDYMPHITGGDMDIILFIPNLF